MVTDRIHVLPGWVVGIFKNYLFLSLKANRLY